ncbi:WD40-repeat-containing domain protein [Cladochytrium replicatum]|nr:WD40-repeat-containing domain protein [Cladochytrium replicatum]
MSTTSGELSRLDTLHDDLIHDVAYDFYGKRLVSCSSDHKLKVWDTDESSNNWVINDGWKAHDSSILKATWSHPEFGQVIASCSFDRTVKIWEEVDHEAIGSGKRWALRAVLGEKVDGAVHEIEFAPNHLGLKFASVGANGKVRIYEAIDIVDLTNWTITEEFDLYDGEGEPDSHHCLSWSKSRFQPQMLVVGCGLKNTARVFRLDGNSKWSPIHELTGHQGVVTDVAWAPYMGRSYQMIATSSKDGHVRLFKLSEDTESNKSKGGIGAAILNSALGGGSQKKKRFKVDMVGEFADHQAEVWRVEWNVTGTILASSGDDGKVRLWKESYALVWQLISIITSETGPGAMIASVWGGDPYDPALMREKETEAASEGEYI